MLSMMDRNISKLRKSQQFFYVASHVKKKTLTYPAVVERNSLVLGFFVVVMGTLDVCVKLLEV